MGREQLGAVLLAQEKNVDGDRTVEVIFEVEGGREGGGEGGREGHSHAL